MKVLLKINYETFLLPSDKGLSTILSALGGMVRVNDRNYESPPIIELDSEVRIEATILPSHTVYKLSDKSCSSEDPEERISPEVARKFIPLRAVHAPRQVKLLTDSNL